jgi:hypothetical protein
MADTVKISELTEIASGALDDNSVVPVTDGGVTYKLPISKLKDFVGITFATDAELSAQVSSINSTIDGLDTSDISEDASALYYTDARVKTKLNVEGVISASSQVSIAYDDLTNIPDGIISSSTQVSASAAAAGFGAGGTNLSGTGVVSSSVQISDFNTFVENSVTSSMTVLSASYATTASYAENAGGGGGGSTDYVSNVSFSGTTLTFTGTGNAFNSTVDLSTGDLLDLTDSLNYLNASEYFTDSSSFESRLSAVVGGSSPAGTVSSSAQTIENLGSSGIVSSSEQVVEILPAGTISSSAQVVVAEADLLGITSDDIGAGGVNLFYTDDRVLDYINSIEVVSGSVGAASIPQGTISGSQQIVDLGFTTQVSFLTTSSSLASRIDNVGGVSLIETNIFTAEQRFTDGIKITGSISVINGDIKLEGGAYSGSGAQLSNIPASAIVGGVEVSGSEIVDGDSSVVANNLTGVTITSQTSGVQIFGDIRARSGSFSGSGALLHSIPGDAIVGGVAGGNKIASSSFSASITDSGEFLVGPNATFLGDIYSSGSITATEISVGTTGTPTLFSATNINLSASNAVVVTDSPLRLSPQTDATTGSFTISDGDLVYSSTSNDFYGYKSGSWVSLTQAGAAGTQGFGGTDIISSSGQIAENLPSGVVSSSRQIVSEVGGTTGEMLFINSNEITSSTGLSFNTTTNALSTTTINVTDISYTGTLSGNSDSTGSFGRLEGDLLRINNDYEFPTSDGSVNQVLKTDGNGAISFASVDYSTDIVNIPSGIISSSLQLPTNYAVTDAGNTFNDTQVISGSLFVTQSTVTDVLVLTPKHPKPTLPETGSIIVSASSSGPMRPFFYDGTAWLPMFA